MGFRNLPEKLEKVFSPFFLLFSIFCRDRRSPTNGDLVVQSELMGNNRSENTPYHQYLSDREKLLKVETVDREFAKKIEITRTNYSNS